MSDVAAFHITGKSNLPLTVENLGATMIRATRRYADHVGRIPTDDEITMIWAAVQRYHGVPECGIEPASCRRWN